jgi:hypothetical protein
MSMAMLRLNDDQLIKMGGKRVKALQWYEPRVKIGEIPVHLRETAEPILRKWMEARKYASPSNNLEVRVISEDENGRVVRYVPKTEIQLFLAREEIRMYYPHLYQTMEEVEDTILENPFIIDVISPQKAMACGVRMVDVYDARSEKRFRARRG